MSEPRIRRLVSADGTTRTLEMEDGTVIERHGGSASWRNNNPGNLKFEFAGSADHTVHNPRSRDAALHHAQRHYDGIVGLDQWGNAVFESPEAGRAAQLQLLRQRFGRMTVEQMVEHYSTQDYSGATHHAAQVATIHRTANARGQHLQGKTIDTMSPAELDALGAGIAKFEGFRVGTTTPAATRLAGDTVGTARDRATSSHAHASPSVLQGSAVNATMHHPSLVEREHLHSAPALHRHIEPHIAKHSRALHEGLHGNDVRELQHALNLADTHDATGHRLREDGHFGRHTREAVIGYQKAHDLPHTGIAAERTQHALHAPATTLLTDPAHPAHARFCHTLGCVHAVETERGIAHGPHSERAAGALLAQMQRDGLEHADRVELSTDGRYMRAVQIHPLRDEFALNRMTTPIETARAATQSLAESTLQFGTARRQQDDLDTTLAMRGHTIGAMSR